MKKILCVMMLVAATFGGGFTQVQAQPRVTVIQDAPPPEPCSEGQPREYVEHDASGVDETIKIDGLKAPCTDLTIHLPKAMDPKLVADVPNSGDVPPPMTTYSRTSENELIGVVKDAAAATNELAKRQASWNFGVSSQALAVSHKGDTASYGILGLYGVRATRSTLVQLQGGIGKDGDGNLAIGAMLVAGYKPASRVAIGVAAFGADSINQRDNKDREVLLLRSVGGGPAVTMQLGGVNVTLAGGIAWSGRPVDGKSVDGVVTMAPTRSYDFGPWCTANITVGLRGLLK